MIKPNHDTQPLEAIEMKHERDTGTHSIYRYRGGTGQIDVQICVPYGCLKTEFDLRLVLVKHGEVK